MVLAQQLQRVRGRGGPVLLQLELGRHAQHGDGPGLDGAGADRCPVGAVGVAAVSARSGRQCLPEGGLDVVAGEDDLGDAVAVAVEVLSHGSVGAGGGGHRDRGGAGGQGGGLAVGPGSIGGDEAQPGQVVDGGLAVGV